MAAVVYLLSVQKERWTIVKSNSVKEMEYIAALIVQSIFLYLTTNVRGGSSGCFGLHAANSSSVIHIQAPKNVICDWLAHTGGENFGGKGEIRVDVEGDVHVIREAQEQGEDDY